MRKKKPRDLVWFKLPLSTIIGLRLSSLEQNLDAAITSRIYILSLTQSSPEKWISTRVTRHISPFGYLQ